MEADESVLSQNFVTGGIDRRPRTLALKAVDIMDKDNNRNLG